MSGAALTGLLVVDKPAGVTSHDVVERVRELLRTRAGHAGTLDPQATGVLLVCLGRATRLARFLQGHDKVYEGVIRLGWATDTYDADGEPTTDRVEPPELRYADVERTLQRFVGVARQRPPAYSAKKVRGQPAYRRARRGEPVEPEPVEVEIYAAELLGLENGEIEVRIHCSAGTYVRTLAHELGAALRCPAHLARLRRTRSGPFGLDNAVTWEALGASSEAEVEQDVLPAAHMLPDWPAAVVNAEGAAAVRSGRMVEAGWIIERRAADPGAEDAAATCRGAAAGGGLAETGASVFVRTVALRPAGPRVAGHWVRLLDADGHLLAAGEMVPGGLVQPRVVLG